MIRSITFVVVACLMYTPAVGEFSPQQLDGLALWLDGDDAATMTLAEDTGGVLAWHDKSDAGAEAKPLDGVQPPVHMAEMLNGRGVVRFNGRNALLLGEPGQLDLQGTDDLTFFAVVRARSNGSILAKTDGSRMQYRFHIPGERTLRVALGPGGDQRDTTSTVGSRHFSLLSVVNSDQDGTRRFEMYFDGQRENAGDAGAGTVDAPVVIGARDRGQTQRLDFDLAELIVFDRALGASERQQVERCLSAKFSLDDQE